MTGCENCDNLYSCDNTGFYNSCRKIRQQYTNEDAAYRYQRHLKSKGIAATVFKAYNWAEQQTVFTVDVVRNS